MFVLMPEELINQHILQVHKLLDNINFANWSIRYLTFFLVTKFSTSRNSKYSEFS